MEAELKLLQQNRDWASDVLKESPDYFKKLAEVQKPEFLWIGCSDSRVPADRITGTMPGEIFVHRNIANLVVHNDVNLLAVLEYAVHYLKVKHVIVCGHYGCGGVKAAMSSHNYGIINKWIRNIKDVYRIHRNELNNIVGEDSKLNRLIELNVEEQVHNLANTSIIQKAWKEDNSPTIHGWVYGIENGIIKPLTMMQPGDYIDPIYKFDDL
jgi:carbonic anhydrase